MESLPRPHPPSCVTLDMWLSVWEPVALKRISPGVEQQHLVPGTERSERCGGGLGVRMDERGSCRPAGKRASSEAGDSWVWLVLWWHWDQNWTGAPAPPLTSSVNLGHQA